MWENIVAGFEIANLSSVTNNNINVWINLVADMANPRKFSEKIALHNQKQAEETAEFNRIMKEVSDATNKGSGPKRQQLLIQQLGCYRGGSLPNFNKVMMSPHNKTSLNCMDERDSSQTTNHSHRERPRSAVGPMRSRPAEKRMAPYGSGAYLSPPPDTTWRRTHSDSALHTSSHESANYRKALECQSQMMMDEYDTGRRLSSASPDGRPRSVNDMPRVPGISIYPSQQDPGAIQIPISGNNTGSLPDLTCFHIPSPLNLPLDHDDQSAHCSPYCGSTRSLSPTPHSPSGRLSYVGTPPNEAPGPPSPHMNNANHLFVPSYPSPKALHHSKERLQDSYTSSYLPPISSIHQTTPVQSPFGNTSPCGSSPQSPTSPTSLGRSMNSNADHNSYLIGQANALQYQFEQICMNEDSSQMRSHELTPDPGYFSTSPLQHNPYNRVPQENSPNTPSSIPEIVLSDSDAGSTAAYGLRSEARDEIPYQGLNSHMPPENVPWIKFIPSYFSNSEELSIGKDFRDFGVNMSSLDGDLFPSDECLREGLVPVDLDELQMLNNCPDMIADPATEDHLRLDRL